jgi:hypothetical protein
MGRKSFSLLLSFGLLVSLAVIARADFTAPAKVISTALTGTNIYPKIVSLPGTDYAFVIWIRVLGLEDHLYFSRTADGGATWSTPFPLTTEGQIRAHSGSPVDGEEDPYTLSMAVQGNYIHVVFQWRIDESDDFEIVYLRSSDLGATAQNWEARRYLTDNATDSIHPDVAVSAGLPEYVHFTYTDSWPGNKEIMYKRLTGHGSGDMLTRRLTFSGTDSGFPRVAVSADGYFVHVVYQDWVSGNWGIMYKNISLQGTGPYSTYRLTTSSALNEFPDIAVSSGSPPEDQYVYIVYQTFYPGNYEIMYKRLDQYGTGTFNTYTARLTYSYLSSSSSSVDFDDASNCVHISYHDSWPGNYDIMHKKFDNFGGAGFTTQRVSWGTGDSVDPTVAACGGGAYIAWADASGGSFDIYVKKGG